MSSDRLQDGNCWEEEVEQLEPPLPLKSEDEGDGTQHFCQRCQSLALPSQNWIQRQVSPSVSVNVPHFSVPPEVSGVTLSTTASSSSATSSAASHVQQRRGSLPNESRKIFITCSSDSSCEMMAFVDFLSKHGFQAAVDGPLTTWEDTIMKDPSTPIIVAISPRYKADIEDCAVHTHGLHTKYIYSMMQHEFIQQGSLNFRFIPVLFLNASQKDVPGWLQNTRVYRWPRDTDDLLLRLLREERFVPPPVHGELTLIITPVAATP
ncbi:E3 ubiquitin ligase TRAF3IP2-like isoform X2 [Syngnathus acus]|uniref:E3 ubiquitin ligase TRAF3IP2-like isoform X2 n=1 Tax=Syngnathus acus TaxID=161584 RepID=UPI001885D9B1|nr:E3 ubiquitin ligase TRAF3IP2-like isoform X2 [Syngnathus acus]